MNKKVSVIIMNKKVSVIIPCYNVEAYVEVALLSIIHQTYKNLEIICIDDCSTDNTFDILSRIAKSDSRIVLLRNEQNLKLIKTLNKAIGLATGDYIARMDADDFSLPERIEKQLSFLEKNNLKVCGTLVAFYRNGKLKKSLQLATLHNAMFLMSFFDSPLIHPSTLIVAESLKKFRYTDNEQSFLIEDYELWCRMFSENIPLGNLKEYLFVYRINEAGESQTKKQIQIQNHLIQAEKTIKNSIGISISKKSLWLISGFIGNFSPEWIDVKNAIAELIQIVVAFHQKYQLTENEKQEIINWLHFKQLYILQIAIRKGDTKTKCFSSFWFLTKSTYLVKMITLKALLPFNSNEIYKLL
jgi:glycosyltransferase involved in cell wall biosynthesis